MDKCPQVEIMELKEKLDEFHAHEALDRVHIVMIMIDEILSKHPYIEEDKDIKQAIEDAADHLAKAYQLIGQKHL
jgi:hypothetical protein